MTRGVFLFFLLFPFVLCRVLFRHVSNRVVSYRSFIIRVQCTLMFSLLVLLSVAFVFSSSFCRLLFSASGRGAEAVHGEGCLLYTSDAADE